MAEEITRTGIEIVGSEKVPPDEAWLVQGPKRYEVYYKDGQIAHVVERSAKVLAKIINIEAGTQSSCTGPPDVAGSTSQP